LTRERVLVWDGCVNVRDVGGLPLTGGGETQFGVVVRADSLAGLTDRGWQALEDYGVRSAIDLRGDHELQLTTRRTIPVTRIPITPLAGPGWDWPSMLEAYLAVLEEFRPQFGQVVDALAAADPPALVHCHGGRDRTGLAVALILDAAGVERDAIAADHALSDESWAPYNPAWIAEAADPADAAKRRRITAPARQTMVAVLEEVDRRYGGAAEYVGTSSLDTIVLRLCG
jgi:protein tyrosine/serine phosphatase